MKSLIQMFAVVSFLVPMFAFASLNCSGTQTTLNIEGGGTEVGQSLHAIFINTDAAFGETVAINCQVEKTPSGIFCVDVQPGRNMVLDLTNIASNRILVVEQDHGGYGSEQFEFGMTCKE